MKTNLYEFAPIIAAAVVVVVFTLAIITGLQTARDTAQMKQCYQNFYFLQRMLPKEAKVEYRDGTCWRIDTGTKFEFPNDLAHG